MDQPTADYDSPWKDAIELWLEGFLKLFFPGVHREIDWTVPPHFMDTELRQLFPEDREGRLHVDRLVKLRASAPPVEDVVFHLEVQGRDDRAFRQRVFHYNRRLSGRPEEVVSLALITEGGRPGRTASFRRGRMGSELTLTWPVARLRDLEPRWRKLEASGDPIGLVALAHMASRWTRGQPARRLAWKLRLARRILFGSHEPSTRDHLMRFVDWCLRLPHDMWHKYWQAVMRTEERIMSRPYITQTELLMREMGQEEGREEGVVLGLRSALLDVLQDRFGPEAGGMEERVGALADPARLRQLIRLAATGADQADILRLLESGSADSNGT